MQGNVLFLKSYKEEILLPIRNSFYTDYKCIVGSVLSKLLLKFNILSF